MQTTTTELPKLHSFKLTDQEAALVMALRTEGEDISEALETIFRLALFVNPEPLDNGDKQAGEQVFDLLQIFQGRLGRYMDQIADLNDDQEGSDWPVTLSGPLSESKLLNLPQMRSFIGFVSQILLRMQANKDNPDTYSYPDPKTLYMTRQQYEDACAIVAMHGNMKK